MTLQQLQRITLESQGLLQTSPFGKGKKAVLNVLEQLGYLQIDTLSVVERAHHHTLWTRVPDYKPEHLDELVKERKVFEYWFHAASYLPMKDFRFVLPQMLEVKLSKTHYYNAEPRIMQYVMDKIRTEGSKKARDFKSESKKTGSWWNWKPTKIAVLFSLFALSMSWKFLPKKIKSELSLKSFSHFLISINNSSKSSW